MSSRARVTCLIVLCVLACGVGPAPLPAAAGTAGPRPARVRIDAVRLSDGLRLEYAEQGSAGGVPVLFLHGLTDSWMSWSRVLERLPDHVHAYAPSLRGHGLSDRPDCCYSMSALAADAARFLEAVGQERAVVVGHSMGSFVARRLASEHPARVEKLVLVAGGRRAGNDVVRAFFESLRDLTDPVPDAMARDFQVGTLYRSIDPAFLEVVIDQSRLVPARVWRAAADGMIADDEGPAPATIAAPTLVLWGERDAMFGRRDQRELAASIPGSRLVVYEETGHALHWERPERFVADLLAYLPRR